MAASAGWLRRCLYAPLDAAAVFLDMNRRAAGRDDEVALGGDEVGQVELEEGAGPLAAVFHFAGQIVMTCVSCCGVAVASDSFDGRVLMAACCVAF